MSNQPASVMKKPKPKAQDGVKDRAAELDQDELIEPKNERKQLYDELSERLSSGFYITNKGFSWFYNDSGGRHVPLFVDRFYAQINVAVDFDCDPQEATAKDHMLAEHGIRYGNLVAGTHWDGLIKKLMGD